MINEELKLQIHRYLISRTDFLKVKDQLTEDQLRLFVDRAITDLCEEQQLKVEMDQRAGLIRGLVSAVMSLGPLRPLMEDKTITEIMVNGCKQVYVQRDGHIVLTDVRFDDNHQLLHTVHKILASSGSNKRVDESLPYVDFSMADGTRVNVIIAPCSLNGPVMTIRKFKDDITSVDDLLNRGVMDQKIATLLVAAMKAKLNVIFCGATGSGKTTSLNVFSSHIPEEERIITIEDTPELRLKQEHVVSLLSKPVNIEGKGEITMRDLFVNSLRMRPDRIIIGEVRGVEILDLIQSISSGHSGSLAIVHAETPEDCFNRMVTMMLMTGIRLSTEEIRKQVARAIDIIVHIELYLDGKRRMAYVTDVVYDEEKDKTYLHHIFNFKYAHDGDLTKGIKGEWVMDKRKPSFFDKFGKRGVSLPEDFFDK